VASCRRYLSRNHTAKIPFVFILHLAHLPSMSTVAEVQAAVERLPAADRIALFRWLGQDAAIRTEELASLRAAIDEGDRDLAEGRYTTLETDSDFQALADEIKQAGLPRIAKGA
jgi:hypothetical protein